MGYLCPVCEEPFGSDAQCANHLAVTAIIHGDDHATWLAETVADQVPDADDWESVPREQLAAIVAETATETTDHDHPGDHTHPVSDDHTHSVAESQPDGVEPGSGRSGGAGATGGRSAGSGGGPPGGAESGGGGPGGGGPTGGRRGVQDTTPPITDTDAAQLDADAQAILSEARELTERMQQRGPGDGSSDDGCADGCGDDEGKES